MMRQHFFRTLIFLCLLIVGSLHAKGQEGTSKDFLKQKREIAQFKNISISGAGHLFLKQGSKESLVIEGNANSLSHIKSDVHDYHLYLGSTNEEQSVEGLVNYYVTVKNIEDITSTGAINITCKDTLTTPIFNLTLLGSGSANLKAKANKLNIKISGSSKVTAQGTSLAENIQIEGSGSIQAKNLAATQVNIQISGAGEAEVKAIEVMDVKIDGVGKVKYYGKPKITQEIAGEGEIIPLG